MHAPLRYLEHAPCAALAPLVQCYWSLEGHAPASAGRPGLQPPPTRRVLPDGCVDVLVDLDARAPEARVVGAMQQAVLVPLAGPVSVLGVRFRPGGAGPLLRLALDAVTDGDALLLDVWGHAGAELAPRLLEAGSLTARVRLLERVLLERLARHGSTPDAMVASVVSRVLAARGVVPVRALEAVAGVGERQLERRFRAAVGLTPKVLCRVVRLQHVLARVSAARRPDTRVDWAGLALEGGYCDQAHLAREVRALVGTTPTAWVREQDTSPEHVGSVQDGEATLP